MFVIKDDFVRRDGSYRDPPPCTGGMLDSPHRNFFGNDKVYLAWNMEKTREARKLIERLIYFDEEEHEDRELARRELELALISEAGVDRTERLNI